MAMWNASASWPPKPVSCLAALAPASRRPWESCLQHKGVARQDALFRYLCEIQRRGAVRAADLQRSAHPGIVLNEVVDHHAFDGIHAVLELVHAAHCVHDGLGPEDVAQHLVWLQIHALPLVPHFAPRHARPHHRLREVVAVLGESFFLMRLASPRSAFASCGSGSSPVAIRALRLPRFFRRRCLFSRIRLRTRAEYSHWRQNFKAQVKAPDGHGGRLLCSPGHQNGAKPREIPEPQRQNRSGDTATLSPVPPPSAAVASELNAHFYL
eukprot:scaffold754_cov248-Pinguiococcus_pyrenoidosus.AAC.15